MEQIPESHKKYNEYRDHQTSGNNWTGNFFEIQFFLNVKRVVEKIIQVKNDESKKSSGEEFEGYKSQGKFLIMMSRASP